MAFCCAVVIGPLGPCCPLGPLPCPLPCPLFPLAGWSSSAGLARLLSMELRPTVFLTVVLLFLAGLFFTFSFSSPSLAFSSFALLSFALSSAISAVTFACLLVFAAHLLHWPSSKSVTGKLHGLPSALIPLQRSLSSSELSSSSTSVTFDMMMLFPPDLAALARMAAPPSSGSSFTYDSSHLMQSGWAHFCVFHEWVAERAMFSKEAERVERTLMALSIDFSKHFWCTRFT
mmetsp:Transcript_18316/g.33219  ORF Transcript_18316/g.33219 Transcript_18316/m.33219 type:complete len:231 (+) Transcript_18316:124-816(+)